jgi:hypothetical protein
MLIPLRCSRDRDVTDEPYTAGIAVDEARSAAVLSLRAVAKLQCAPDTLVGLIRGFDEYAAHRGRGSQ